MSVINNTPSNKEAVLTGSVFSAVWYTFINQVFNICFSEQESGTTGDRPTKNLWIGRRYFDTTLGKPIFIKAVTPSVVWVDGAGTVS